MMRGLVCGASSAAGGRGDDCPALPGASDRAGGWVAAASSVSSVVRPLRFLVAGGQNVDRLGRSDAPLRWADSNPGRISESFGGVGLNVARNLAGLGGRVCFFSAYGDDRDGAALRQYAESLGLEVRSSPTIPGTKTSTYIALHDANGDMAVALNDMAIFDRFGPEYLDVGPDAARPRDVAGGPPDCAVLDGNLCPEMLETLARRLSCPVLADPVSAAKSERLRPILQRLTLIKPNRVEAEILCAMRIRDLRDAARATRRLLSLGPRYVFLSCGADGLIAAHQEQTLLFKPPQQAVKNATGAGDAMLAGLTLALSQGRPLREMAAMGMAAAVCVLQSDAAYSPALTEIYLTETARRMPAGETLYAD